MLVSDDGFVGGFCCDKMEKYSTKPQKCISFDLWYQEFGNSPPEMKACIFSMEPSGVSKQEYTASPPQKAGYSPISISYCPWCGKKIEFT